jgi:histidine triad (HIT) family protein
VSYCTFCNIVAGSERADVLYDDSEVLVFRNRLRWLPLMLLVVPTAHLRQEELWTDLGAVGRVAAEMGRRYCPHGFRLVSNFGWDALQSQQHAHVHVLGGDAMHEVAVVDEDTDPECVVERDGFRIVRPRSQWPPLVLVGEPRNEGDQFALWANMGEIGAELVRLGLHHCPYGFRLVSNFGWDALQARPHGQIYLLGGTELGHYV